MSSNISEINLRWVTLNPLEVNELIKTKFVTRVRLVEPRPYSDIEYYLNTNGSNEFSYIRFVELEGYRESFDLNERSFKLYKYSPNIKPRRISHPFGDIEEVMIVKEKHSIVDGNVVFNPNGDKRPYKMPINAHRIKVRCVDYRLDYLTPTKFISHGMGHEYEILKDAYNKGNKDILRDFLNNSLYVWITEFALEEIITR